MKRFPFFLFVLMTIGLIACSPMAKLAKAQTALLQDSALKGAHLGVAVYDPATGNYLYDYQSDHYFVPASNTKLFTCYAAMKYLGDSLVGARYKQTENTLFVKPTGDPTFLHPDFEKHPLLALLKSHIDTIAFDFSSNRVKKYGPGWSWDDYAEDYMPERSQFPIFGNVVWFYIQPDAVPNTFKSGLFGNDKRNENGYWIYPKSVTKGSELFFLPENKFSIKRRIFDNSFYPEKSTSLLKEQAVPFITENGQTAEYIIADMINKNFVSVVDDSSFDYKILHSQPTDSLLRPMMHRSDNFFAEQSLLMVSNEKLGYMSDEAIIDTLLQNNLKDLPQKPVWVDGCGLSRYNLFTPQDMVAVLLKIKNEFGLERIKNILPKGNTGTLTNYYQSLGPAIFAKTGSLSGVVALSGYLNCKSGKLLLFSILVNNHNSSGRAIRRAVEKFVMQVWEKN